MRQISSSARRVVALATAFATVLFPSVTRAQSDPAEWSPVGPFGGFVEELQASPHEAGIVYARLRGGLFKTSDGGGNWHRVNLDGVPSPAPVIRFHPSRPQHLFAITEQAIYRRTADAGDFKAITPDEERETGYKDLAISSAAPDLFLMVNPTGVWRSRNAGDTWTLVRRQPYEVDRIFAAPTDAGTFISVERNGVFKTADAGDTWSKLPLDTYQTDIAFSPIDPDTIFATGATVHRSTDGGLTWQRLGNGLRGWAFEVEVSPADPSVIYTAGHGSVVDAARSTDGGETWTNFPSMPGAFMMPALAVDPFARDAAYVGTGGPGIFKTNDGGETVHEANNGLTGAIATSVTSDPDDRNIVFTGIFTRGIYRSLDGGRTWEHVAKELAPDHSYNVSVRAIEVTKSEPSAVLAAVLVDSNEGGSAAFSVQRSLDRGDTWEESTTGLPADSVVFELVADDERAGHVYAGVGIERLERGEMDGGVYKSTDAGASWEYIGPRRLPITSMTMHAATGTLLVSAGAFNNQSEDDHLFISHDRGQTWDEISYPPDFRYVRGLAIGPTPNDLYAGNAAGSSIASSHDGGKTWSRHYFDPTGRSGLVHEVAVDPINPSMVYVASEEGGLWISGDYGHTWEQANGHGYSAQALEVPRPDTAPSESGRRSVPLEGVPQLISGAGARTSDAMPVYAGAGGRGRGGVWRVVPAPDVYRRPRIEGRPRFGARLTCRPGRWSRASRFDYRWFRNGAKMDNADRKTYRIRRGDAGDRLICRVTARGPGGRGTAKSRALLIRR